MNRFLIGLVAVLVAAAGEGGGSTVEGWLSDSSTYLQGTRDNSEPAAATTSSGAGSAPAYTYRRIPTVVCGAGINPRSDSPVPCMDEGDRTVIQIRTCEDGSIALDPLHRRAVSAETGGYVPGNGWEQVDNGGCPEEPAPQVVMTVEEFRRLPIEVRTPVQFAWDFGDGSALIRTTAAGHEWPHHAALGEYPEPGEFELRLTTTWRGEYRVDGAGPWLPVAGTASTTSDPVAISVETAPARLVSEF